MDKVTAKDFQSKIDSSENIRISDLELVDNNEIAELNKKQFSILRSKFLRLTFRKCNFDELILRDCDLHYISFIDCQIKTLRIHGSKIFEHCVSDDMCEYNLFEISNCVPFKRLSINNSILRNYYSEETNFTEVYIVSTIERCRFLSNRHAEYSSLKFIGNFETIAFFSNQIVACELSRVNCDTISFNGSHCNSLKIVDLNAKQVEINGCHPNEIELEHIDVGRFKVIERKLKTFKINGSFKGFLVLEAQDNLKVSELIFENLTLLNGSLFNFANTDFQSIKVDFLENLGTITIDNGEICRMLTIDSNLGNLILKNIKSQYPYLILLRSNISKAKLIAGSWSKVLVTNFDNAVFSNVDEYLVNLRETYNQLKDAALKVNDKFASLEFKNKELIIQNKLLSHRKFNRENGLLNNFANYLIHWTHKVFSNYSLSIVRPLFCLFFFHLLWNWLQIYFNDKVDLRFTCSSADMVSFCQSASLYFQTILPTHSIQVSLDGGNPTIYVGGFIDVVSRVSSAYFIFYFIAASRKYHQQ